MSNKAEHYNPEVLASRFDPSWTSSAPMRATTSNTSVSGV